MRPLQGVGVLVTRPEQQALPLCRLLEAEGAATWRLPAIEIEPAADLDALQRTASTLSQVDLVIFTSANAVRFGAPLLAGGKLPPLAAIGPATARALEAQGLTVAVQPAGGFDSESLLNDPLLARPAGRRILIVKGESGRELLQSALEQRGARITIAEVYRRSPARHAAAEVAALAARLRTGELHVVTATSVDIAAALLQMATGLGQGLAQLHWLVPSGRVAQALRDQGLRAPIVQAETADDQGLVAALLRWRSQVSGA